MAPVRRLLIALLACLALPASGAVASEASKPWPPASAGGLFFIHFGEEHWNDDDSDLTLIRVVADAAKYHPDLVTTSGDKANDGTVEQLTRWKQIMSAFDRAGVPYLAGVGNHDRTSPPGVPPGTAGLLTPGVPGNIANYQGVFADRPFPFGDAAPYPGIGPARPGSDPAGASSHYYADIGNVRWIFIDNSCWGISDCDSFQSPSFPDAEGIDGQFEFLELKAREATNAGRHVFVVMHIPTRDPRDQAQIESTSFNHVMGKGINPGQSANNGTFEEIAQRSGVDGVFVGHIKGQWTYRGSGNVPYYIDGGAGGELYTNGPLGTDFGFWHGYRVIHVQGSEITTDVVPILRPGSIKIDGPEAMAFGRLARFEATGIETKNVGPDIEVDLRDPDPIPKRDTSGTLGEVGAFFGSDGAMILMPPAVLLVALLFQTIRSRGRRFAALGPAMGLFLLGFGTVAIAGDGPPTATPKSSLPEPARIWTSSNRFVLSPVSFGTDDPRRNRKTQTEDGGFRARCPGRESVTLTSGFEETSKQIHVPSGPGKIVDSIAVRGRRARVKLHQRAEVFAQVKKGKKVVRNLRHGCFPGGKKLRFRWGGQIKSRALLRPAPPGRYKLQVLVRSDRKTIKRSGRVRIRR